MKDFIKHSASAFLLSLLFLFSAKAQTNVSGFINANTNWTVAGNPYIVTSNALVSQGYTLTIDPGVVVKFNLNCALQVDGELIAIGTAANRITFTSNQPSPAAGDWGKLHIADNAIDAVYDTNGNYLSGTILKYCDVLYGGGVSFGEVHIVSASPYISQCNVKYSKAAGIYCVYSTYVLDSSLVSDNTDYGLYFANYSQAIPCNLTIQGDTIRNNSNGGIFLSGGSNKNCPTVITNNYLVSNSKNGAINNSGVHSFEIIKGNYILNNSTNIIYRGIITYGDHSYNIRIEENYFANNLSLQDEGGIIYFYNESESDTIRCNVFLNNQLTGIHNGVIYHHGFTYTHAIRNNVFDGNVNNTPNGFCVLYNPVQYAPSDFSNNTVKNNSAPSGTCCYFNSYLKNNTKDMRISHNEFSNNTSKYVIYLDGQLTGNSNYDFLYLKHNNFLDVSFRTELYNHIPYGSPNVHADSNYWGSTSTQHVDSIIYDYFDTANYSVVYYLPILMSTVEVDTACSFSIPTSVAERNNEEQNSQPYPNPFSGTTTILFKEQLKDASLIIYNVFGQKVKSIAHINTNTIRVERENLISGIYIYEVIEKHRRITAGKLVVE